MVNTVIFKVIFVIASYLLGSVCFGYVFAKFLKNKDFGKKDLPGAAGSFRNLGPKIGIMVGFLDAAKGVIPPLLAKFLGLDNVTIVIACLAVVVGHSWPIFFKFRGGGGLTTIIGISLVLVPIEFAIAFPVAIAGGYIYKYTLGKRFKIHPNPVGGVIGTFLLPVLAFIFNEPLLITLLFTLLFILTVVKGAILYIMYNKKSNAVSAS
jgi:acyl-phosphate glycerol 3-phosphate acyltransferase